MLKPSQDPQGLTLLEAARKVRLHGYSPYYHVQVGAALLGRNQKVYVGCNVENASGAAHNGCAEANALAAAIADGERSFQAIAVVAFDHEFATPCGPCRQKLFEFCDDLTIYLGLTQGSELRKVTLAELLPYGFKLS